jgi:mono/diheme cytochrome c family protein
MIACLRAMALHRNLKTAHLMVLGIVAAASLATAQTIPNTETTENIYKTNCATCHGEDGSGTALGNRLHVKDLRTREIQQQSTKVLAQTITAGKGYMPAFGTRLDSEQIQKLVEYIRHKARK